MEPYNIIVENEYGHKLQLTQSRDYIVREYSGGFFPTAAVTTYAKNSVYDGEKLQSALVGRSSLNLSIVIRREAEKNRLQLYRFFRPSSKVKIYYANGSRNVYQEGVVEDTAPNPFAIQTTVNVVISCENPYWRAVDETVTPYSSVINNFYFIYPQTTIPDSVSYLENLAQRNIINNGEVQTGFEVKMTVFDALSNPRLINRDTGEYFELDFDFISGDTIHISTIDGEEEVYLTRNAVDYNLFNYVVYGSTWLKLRTGDNIFAYSAEKGSTNADFTVRHRDLFIGV